MSVSLRRASALAAVLACLGVSPKSLQTVAYLQVPSVNGPVTSGGYDGAIQLLSYSFGTTYKSGKVAKSNGLTFVKNVDSTSPAFSDAYFQNRPFRGSTTLTVVETSLTGKSSAAETITLSNVLVVSDSGAGDGGGSRETIKITFTAMNVCAPSGKSTTCAQWSQNNTASSPRN
jgi:type VI protein secretion system component Hcp